MSKQRIPNPYDQSLGKTEWTCATLVAQWINEIIKEKKLDLGEALVETKKKNEPERNDVIIRASQGSDKILCCIEFKAPYYSAFDEKNLKNPARDKANQFKAPYFCTSNFQWLIWLNTARANANEPEERQMHEKYHLSEVENLDLIEESRYKKNIQDSLARFLLDLYEVHTKKKPEPLLPVDAFLIFRLQEKVKILARFYRTIIDDKAHKDEAFSKSLQQWFFDQNWSFAWQDTDFEKAARQAGYLLVNKILFYDLLQAKRPHDFNPLSIPEDLTKGGLLQSLLEGYFKQVLKVDYETIYNTDFIDQVAFPEDKRVVGEIKELINLLRRYDFSKLGFDVIGGIFERLIPAEERHILGQYFTNPDVVDLILKFCLKHEDDRVFDPSCGAGTFLVRAYKHKQLMNQRLDHQQILKTLWGTDIAKFPAHLSTINLAINDLAVDENYPQILQEDFFNLRLGGREEFGKEARRKKLVTIGDNKVVIEYPKIVDCIVGNPPYTRQEEIADISAAETYKEELIRKALHDGQKKVADISKRAGIYAYFFVHGTKFLQNGGHFGFVVSNSWLDVDYGKGIQEFFLKHYKIVAIVESKVERWFVDADINTCIVILERCTDKAERDENLVRFVYLLKPLRHFIPAAQDLWEKQLDRITEIEKLIKTILAHNEFYQNEELRIYPKKQSDLWKEGLESVDEEGKEIAKYAGSKWGKYLRAPEIFFKIIEKGKDKLVPLKDIANVRFGIKTGANEFFYLTEEEIREKGIEKEYWMHKEDGKWVPNYIIKSPRECLSLSVDREDLKFRVLMIHKEKKDLSSTAVLRWIHNGEKKGFHKRPTCASRGDRWFDLGEWDWPDFVWSDAYNDRFAVYDASKTWADKRFFFIDAFAEANHTTLHAYLNSTVIPLLVEIGGITNLGEGAIYTNVYWLQQLFVPGRIRRHEKELAKVLEKLKARKVESIFEEVGAHAPAEVSLERVMPDRRALDKIVMEEILGLTEDEQLEIYRAVVDLVKSRLEKAKSVAKSKKTKEGVDVEALVKVVMEKVGGETLGTFYKTDIVTQKPLTTKTLPRAAEEVRVVKELFDWYLYIGDKKVKCGSELEARYLKVWAETGVEQIKMPKDEKVLKTVVPKLEKLKASLDKVVQGHLDSIIDRKTRAKIAHFVWAELMK
jgi:type I restriction-modification system DNA methylase subunit/chorismate mutase